MGLDLEVSSEHNGSEWLSHTKQAKWSCPSRLVSSSGTGKELASKRASSTAAHAALAVDLDCLVCTWSATLWKLRSLRLVPGSALTLSTSTTPSTPARTEVPE